MPISEAELQTRCEALFGDALDTERRAALRAALASIEKGHPRLMESLDARTEPAGHAGFLRSLAGE